MFEGLVLRFSSALLGLVFGWKEMVWSLAHGLALLAFLFRGCNGKIALGLRLGWCCMMDQEFAFARFP